MTPIPILPPALVARDAQGHIRSAERLRIVPVPTRCRWNSVAKLIGLLP